MNENENFSSENQPQKHILSLHVTKKGEQKTIYLRKGHIFSICLMATLVLGGTAFSVSSYYKTKNQLIVSEQQLQEVERSKRKLEQNTEVLQNENVEYQTNIQQIQEKATEMEQKINELESVKEELSNQLNNITTSSTDSSAVRMAVAAGLEEGTAEPQTFTSIVATSYNKVTALSVQLDRIDSQLTETGVSFASVAENVTETLAAFSDIPSGMPVMEGILTTEFNPSGDSFISDGRTHKGIDLSTRRQIVPVRATAAGTVIASSFDGGYGNSVVIDHGNGFTTLYAHNSENLVSVGDKVKKNDAIAMTGSTGQSTGIHCHYEIQLNGIYQNPLDYE